MHWAESGGPLIEAEPGAPGFGTTLVTNTVAHQLGGTLHYDGCPGGLALQIRVPVMMLAD